MVVRVMGFPAEFAVAPFVGGLNETAQGLVAVRGDGTFAPKAVPREGWAKRNAESVLGAGRCPRARFAGDKAAQACPAEAG